MRGKAKASQHDITEDALVSVWSDRACFAVSPHIVDKCVLSFLMLLVIHVPTPILLLKVAKEVLGMAHWGRVEQIANRIGQQVVLYAWARERTTAHS